jgi:glycogen debranching enzyme
MYEWLKYNTDWLIRNVPEIGIGLSAGLPDYPWWFGGDAVYSLQGVLATGDHELAKNAIILLEKVSKETNGNGRIIHEVSTNGSVYNPGLLSETALCITLLRNYFAWTGDKELITELFPDVI